MSIGTHWSVPVPPEKTHTELTQELARSLARSQAMCMPGSGGTQIKMHKNSRLETPAWELHPSVKQNMFEKFIVLHKDRQTLYFAVANDHHDDF